VLPPKAAAVTVIVAVFVAQAQIATAQTAAERALQPASVQTRIKHRRDSSQFVSINDDLSYSPLPVIIRLGDPNQLQ
jgi:hypothetical protein